MTATAEAPRAAAPRPEPASLPALLLRHAAERPERVALREKRLGRWRETTWASYAERAARVGLGLRELGVAPGDRVAIHSENRPEWVLADLGAQGIGAIVTGVYPTSPAAEVEYLLGHSEAAVVVVEDEEQLDKALAVRERLPALRAIVLVDPRNVRGLDDPTVLTFAELEARGARRERAEWDASAASLDPHETAIIVYTSGTTGPPKGAMLTHANLIAAAEAFRTVYELDERDEVLSYLPLAHVAERLFSVGIALGAGYAVNFGEGGESFAQDLRDVQPTFFLGVPRVWEKMMASVEIRMADASRLKRAAHRAALRSRGPLARVVHRPLLEKLGLSRCTKALSGAAPIAPRVLEYFRSLGVPVREGYGQTENTAVCTFTPAGDVRLGTVGRALPGVEIRVADDGEVLTRSPAVFKGYFRDPEATAATIDRDGWLRTGDVGALDEDGFLTITDRKKDVIITAGGKNVSPSEIENRLKVSPYVREAVVIGDRRRFLTALVGIEGDTVGDWATRRGLPFTTYADLAGKPEVRELVQGVVDEVNRDLAQVETIKRFALLDKELDHEDGELTATQKVKRRAIEERFAGEIEALYA
ncbi:MAG TPA: AMP-binding protein [Solirubrobacteraceae bacterium]|jgi:long-chain acyl-CoA synthetase|nr:AMP-binding protein [Solirubrobacteraceae bacterium]